MLQQYTKSVLHLGYTNSIIPQVWQSLVVVQTILYHPSILVQEISFQFHALPGVCINL